MPREKGTGPAPCGLPQLKLIMGTGPTGRRVSGDRVAKLQIQAGKAQAQARRPRPAPGEGGDVDSPRRTAGRVVRVGKQPRPTGAPGLRGGLRPAGAGRSVLRGRESSASASLVEPTRTSSCRLHTHALCPMAPASLLRSAACRTSAIGPQSVCVLASDFAFGTTPRHSPALLWPSYHPHDCGDVSQRRSSHVRLFPE